MRGWDPTKQISTVKERCLESKKDEYGVRQCVLNAGHIGAEKHKKGDHLFPVHYDPKVIAKVNKRVESELKKAMSRRR